MANQKLVESAIRKIVKKVLIENDRETYDDLRNKFLQNTKYVRFDSHRAMDKATRILGRLPEYVFYSFWYEGHYYPMDEQSISKIQGIAGVKVVNKLPKDLSKWSFKVNKK